MNYVYMQVSSALLLQEHYLGTRFSTNHFWSTEYLLVIHGKKKKTTKHLADTFHVLLQ